MKTLTLLFLFCFEISLAAIFGVDSRQELNQFPLPAPAQATAILIQKDFIQSSQNPLWAYRKFSLQQAYPLCSGELFVEQPVLGTCSGVLIGPDTLITAGHCVRNERICSQLKITFGWTLKKSLSGSLPAQDVYLCQKIIAQKNTQREGDYAILKLDRHVRNVRPVVIAQHEPHVRDRVVSLSHPLGLPLKSDVGFVTRNEPSLLFFETQLDTFTGSSGSGLFNSAGELVGVLSSGAEDFNEEDIHRVQTSGGCLNFKRCGQGDCRSERYFKVKSIRR